MEKVINLLTSNGFKVEVQSPAGAIFSQGTFTIQLLVDGEYFSFNKIFEDGYIEENHYFTFEDIQFEIEG